MNGTSNQCVYQQWLNTISSSSWHSEVYNETFLTIVHVHVFFITFTCSWLKSFGFKCDLCVLFCILYLVICRWCWCPTIKSSCREWRVTGGRSILWWHLSDYSVLYAWLNLLYPSFFPGESLCNPCGESCNVLGTGVVLFC